MGVDAAGAGSKGRYGRLESSRLGTSYWEDSPRTPSTGNQRLHSQAIVDAGPPVADDYIHSVVDAIDAVAEETGKTEPQIAIDRLLQRPTVSTVIIGARRGSTAPGIWAH